MQDKTILILDDMPFDRKILGKAIMRTIQCKILEANSGMEGLEMLAKEKIDLILLDIEMPEMTGDQIVTKIREQKSAIELPIIMVSGNIKDEMVTKCLKNGANDYITKPLNYEISITRIMNHLRLVQAIRDKEKLVHMNKTLLEVHDHMSLCLKKIEEITKNE